MAKYHGSIAAMTDHMRATEAANLPEIVLRYIVVASVTFALWQITGNGFFAGAGGGYLLLSGLYTACLRWRAVPDTRAGLVALVGLGMAITGWYSCITIYVLTMGTPIYEFIGLCGVMGLALRTLGRHSEITIRAVWDNVMVLAGALTATGVFASKAETPWGQAAVLIAGLGAAGYYLFVFSDAARLRAHLGQTAMAEAEARKMHAIGNLTAGMAQDFNNILTAIRGNLDLLSEMPDSEDRHIMLDQARQSTARAAHLVQQLLAFSGKARIRPTPVPLPDLLPGVARRLRDVMPRTIQVELAEPMPIGCLMADAGLLDHAIMACAINARDALMRQGGGTLRMRGETDRARGLATLVIEDDGPGIPPDLLPRVTEPFVTTKRAGEGPGLGLSMVRGFARQSGGRLELVNRIDGGFQARLTLPMAAPSEVHGDGQYAVQGMASRSSAG